MKLKVLFWVLIIALLVFLSLNTLKLTDSTVSEEATESFVTPIPKGDIGTPMDVFCMKHDCKG